MTNPADTTLESKTTMRNFEELLPKIEIFGKKITSDFKLKGEILEFYRQLYYYFSGNENFKGSLKKGLLISGNVGCGKTTAMKIFKMLSGRFVIHHTRHIVREFSIDGMNVLNKYGKINHICFDDFGLEDTNSQLYGNKANVIGEIMLDRYDYFINYGMKTYATTNLSPIKIEEIYGDRLRDRLREMMNFLVLKGKTLRK